MNDRFDLEQQILDCWHVTDDIQLLFEHLEKNPSQDEIANALLGIKTIYAMKFDKMWNTFEQCIAKGELK